MEKNKDEERKWYYSCLRDMSYDKVETYESESAERILFLYKKITGSTNDIGLDDLIGKKELMEILLFHFGFLTRKQWGILFGEDQAASISIYAKRCNSSSYCGDKAVLCTECSNGSRIYSLNRNEYTAIMAHLDDGYLRRRRFAQGLWRGKAPGSHSIAVLDAIYCLLANKDIMPFRYFSFVALDDALSVSDSMLKVCSNEDDVTDRAKGIIADGVLSFTQNGHLFIEQDMLTESMNTIHDKICAYGNYFGTHTDDAGVSCVAMNVGCRAKDTEKGLKKCGDGTHYKAAVENLKNYFRFGENEDDRSVYDAYIFYTKMLEKNPRSKAPRSVLRLIEGCSHELDMRIEFLSRELLDDYADKVIAEQEHAVARKRAQRKYQRVGRMTDEFTRLVNDRDNVGLRKAVAAGLSFTFTIDEDLAHSAEYIFPQQSEVPHRMMRKGVPFAEGYSSENKPVFGNRIVSDGKQHFLLRYASPSDDEKTFIAFEEISADRAARYRVANFFRRYFSGNPLVVVVLFVSCKEDAVSFCNDAKIYDNIAVGETPKKQNRGARIRCCFYDYGARDGFFMPDLDGKPHYFA